jgi:sugar phosphate isomerase/epimerase
MQLGIFAKTFPGSDPATVLQAARAAGYEVVQYNMACSGLASMREAIPEGIAQAVAAAAKASGVRIAAVSATYNMIHPDPAVRERGHTSLRAIASAAPIMGTRLLTLCTGTRDPDDQWRGHRDNDTPEAWRDLHASMEAALMIADACDVDLGIEPERANVIDSASCARRLLDDMKSPRLKIVIDPANLVETEPADEKRRIISEAIGALGDRIVLAHAKDRTADGAFATAGRGVLDFSHYLRELKGSGFDGPLITHGLAAVEASDVARFLQSAMAAAGSAARECRQ